ncbi:hypothetical protein AB0D13_41885 [Streptomyces sp. NPDC048430]|uniref:hypothetical protein n=1 Tax=Streptomyces sp. NPDC048430 TaxID=3155388 RepID=UPI0034454378
MSAHSEDTVSQSVSVLTLSARITESGSVTPLPETVRPVSWAAHYAATQQSWERVAEARVNDEVAPILIETAKPASDVAYLYGSVERWQRATVAERRRTLTMEAHARVVGEMRREALAAIDEAGAAFQPVEWEESTNAFRMQGEWTVTVSARGTDHTAVRETFAAGLPGRRDEILTDAQKRIPRVEGTVKGCTDTPEKVRKAWLRDRRKGTAPKPATGAYSPGSWVSWQHPETGQSLTGIVTKWLVGERSDAARRTVVPSDGSDPLVMVLESRAKPTSGPWNVFYGEMPSLIKPGC